MFKTLLKHEILGLMKSRRVIWSISIFFILFAIVFTIRVKDFKQRQQNYISDMEKVKSDNQNAKNYSYLGLPVIRKPQISSIYNEGSTHSFGTYLKVQIFDPIYSAGNNSTSENVVYKFPPEMDITYLITFFLSLFVLIISFDSINGEKEQGTLKMLFVYPIKRFHFVVKKIIGTISFVGLVFGIPYLASIAYLLIFFPSELNFSVIQFFITYFIYAIMYLLVITLVGILFSILTKSSGKSLIFSLLFWITFSIIIPISYNYFSDNLIDYVKLSNILERQNKIRDRRNRNLLDVSDDINPNKYGHRNWNGGYLNNLTVYGDKKMFNAHINYLKYYYKNYYQEIKEDENLNIEKIRLLNRPKKMMTKILFFDPNVLFEKAAESISMTGVTDYLNYLQAAISLREEFTNEGIKDKWLFSRKYITLYSPEKEVLSYQDWFINKFPKSAFKKYFSEYSQNKKGRIEALKQFEKYNQSKKDLPKKIKETYQIFSKMYMESYLLGEGQNLKRFTFDLPQLPKFVESKLNINIVIKRTLPNLILLTFMILILLIVIDLKFKKFDLR